MLNSRVRFSIADRCAGASGNGFVIHRREFIVSDQLAVNSQQFDPSGVVINCSLLAVGCSLELYVFAR